jgi:hypothetical protein
MPKLTWYVNRLRAMTPAEVGYRLRHSAQTRVDRVRLSRERLPGWELPEALDPADVPFFFDPATAEVMRTTWEQEYPGGLARLRAEADELLAGRATVFDREMNWTEAPNWHLNLLTGEAWPRRFWSDMPIRDGGVKYVWELARHQHLMTLARAYFLTGHAPYGTAACRWLKSWIDENPPYTGIHWTSALELGLRLIAWSWSYRLLQGHAAWTKELEQEFFRLVQLQSEFIRRYHSAHSSANNHLIGEAAGVAMAGLAFPWLADADRWREWGLTVLAEELPRQVYADGVSAEQTFHYQAFVMDLVLQPVLLGRCQSREMPVELPERLEAMAAFLFTAMDTAGHVPAVGDADDGAAILLGQEPHHPYRSLLATCGVLFNRPEFCRAAGTFDEKSEWLLGSSGRERFQRLSTDGARRTKVACEMATGTDGAPVISDSRELSVDGTSAGSRQFREGGYTVLRSGRSENEQLILLDHGPLGYLSIAAHGHADALSMVMHLGGRPVLVDPGTYVYHEQPEWREYFRGTPAHNTLTVEGQHQSVMTGPTMWGRRASARATRWASQSDYDFVEAEHDGYQRLPGRPLHRRTVFHSRDGATFIVDRLLGDGTHSAELNWHLGPGAQLEPAGPDAWQAIGEGFQLHLALLGDGTLETAMVEGQEQPAQGWVSPRFGTRVPAPVLSVRRTGPLPMAWVTVLLPETSRSRLSMEGDGLNAGSHHARCSQISGRVDTRGVVVTLECSTGREIYAQSFVESGEENEPRAEGGPEAEAPSPASPPSLPWLDLGEGRYRGQAAHLRFDDQDRLVHCSFVGGLELEWNGHGVWRSSAGGEDTCVEGPLEAVDPIGLPPQAVPVGSCSGQ